MENVIISTDNFQQIEQSAKELGVAPWDLIKALLAVSEATDGRAGKAAAMPGAPASQSRAILNTGDELADVLRSPDFLAHRSVVGRFLFILSWLCKRNPGSFDKVVGLGGRRRRYFAKSAQELTASGTSVMPKRIPNTPYWVITNSPTQGKKQLLADVMRMIGCASARIQAACDALDKN